MSGFLCFSTVKNCYATAWSYGEICVHSNCCGRLDKSRKAIIKARIAYHKELLEGRKNFSYWADNEKVRAIQEKNIKADIVHHQKMLKRLRTGSLAK